MFQHLAIALVGALLTVMAAWRALGFSALLLAPVGASFASLAVGIVAGIFMGRLPARERRGGAA